MDKDSFDHLLCPVDISFVSLVDVSFVSPVDVSVCVSKERTSPTKAESKDIFLPPLSLTGLCVWVCVRERNGERERTRERGRERERERKKEGRREGKRGRREKKNKNLLRYCSFDLFLSSFACPLSSSSERTCVRSSESGRQKERWREEEKEKKRKSLLIHNSAHFLSVLSLSPS